MNSIWSKSFFLIKNTGFVCFCALLVLACGKGKKETGQHSVSPAVLDSGEFLAKTYCGSCHLFPSPDLLDKKTWKDHVLPNMGYRYGIYRDRIRDSLIEKGMAGRIVIQANIFPRRQLISDSTWQKIKKFYIDRAPDELNTTQENSNNKNLTLFTPIIPDFRIPRPAVTAIAYDRGSRLFYVADCSREGHSTINILDAKFKPVTSLGLPHPVSNLALRSDTLYMLMMGHFIPSDEPAGRLIKALKDKQGRYTGYSLVLKDLKRPVDVAYADVDNDKDEDIIICEFGNHTGSVSLFLKIGKNKYKKETLSNNAGAIRVVVQDLNNDSLPDILVLTAQGDEGIDLYYNNGNGKFTRERVLRFPAVYGSSSFLLADMNRDGYPDIVYVNGDNADVSRVLKPYHGVRIFLNDKRNQFTEEFFYPVHGAYKATVNDYDQDGDLDIGVISFFPDFRNNPEEGFGFLENTSANGTLNFAAHTFPEATKGRWITMVEADIDLDGDDDLVLGSFTSMEIPGDSTGEMKKKFSNDNCTVLVMQNTTIK